MTVSVQYAAEHLEELLSALAGGESVDIERADQPAVRLSAVVQAASPPQVGQRILGAGLAFSRLPSEEELDRIDREWKRDLEDRPVFPSEQP